MTYEENLALRNQVAMMKALIFIAPNQSVAQGELYRQIAETEAYIWGVKRFEDAAHKLGV